MRSTTLSLGLLALIALTSCADAQRGHQPVHIPVRAPRGRLTDRIAAQHRQAPARYNLWHAKAAADYGEESYYDDYSDNYSDDYSADYYNDDGYYGGDYYDSGYGGSYSTETPSYDDYNYDSDYADSYSTETPGYEGYSDDYYGSGHGHSGSSYSTETPSHSDYYYDNDYSDSYSTSTPSHDDNHYGSTHTATPYSTATPTYDDYDDHDYYGGYGDDYSDDDYGGDSGRSDKPVQVNAGQSAFYWYADIGVGTPSQKFTVAFDISSSLSWIRKAGGCDSSYGGYSSVRSDVSAPEVGCNGFDGSQSKTFKGDGHEVEVQTQDFGTFKGHFYSDVWSVAGLKATTQFAKIYPEDFPKDYPFDGAIGLALPSTSSSKDKVKPWFLNVLHSSSGCSSPIYGLYPAQPYQRSSSGSSHRKQRRSYGDDYYGNDKDYYGNNYESYGDNSYGGYKDDSYSEDSYGGYNDDTYSDSYSDDYYKAPEHKLVFCGLDLNYYPGLNASDAQHIDTKIRKNGLGVTTTKEGFWQVPFLGLSDGKSEYYGSWESKKKPPQAIFDTNSIQIRLAQKQLAKVHKRIGAKGCANGLCEVDCNVRKSGPTFTFSFGSAADFAKYTPSTPPSNDNGGGGGGSCQVTYKQHVALCGVNTKSGSDEYKACMGQADAWLKICEVQTSYSASSSSSTASFAATGKEASVTMSTCKGTHEQYVALCGTNTAAGTLAREECVDMADAWFDACKAHAHARLKKRTTSSSVREFNLKFTPDLYVLKDGSSGKCYSAFTDFGCTTSTKYGDDGYNYRKRRLVRKSDDYYGGDDDNGYDDYGNGDYDYGYYECQEPKDLIVVGSAFLQGLPVSFYIPKTSASGGSYGYKFKRQLDDSSYAYMYMPECQNPTDQFCIPPP